jgi:hypothetical protein
MHCRYTAGSEDEVIRPWSTDTSQLFPQCRYLQVLGAVNDWMSTIFSDLKKIVAA